MLDFDPAELQILRVKAKRQLRQRMRATRGAVPAGARAQRSERIVAHLLASAEYQMARTIALFWPIVDRGEVDLRALDTRCREQGRTLYYPAADAEAGRRGFRQVDDPATLQERGFGFAEPSLDAPWAEPGQLDWIVVPALAVTESHHRLGYGSGFYDAVLPEFCPPARSVVVAFSFQVLAELPIEAHDKTCDAVITDAGRL